MTGPFRARAAEAGRAPIAVPGRNCWRTVPARRIGVLANGRLIAEGVLTPNQMKATDYNAPPKASWPELILVSLAGIAVLLAISCWRFDSRDY